jgi:hypothetical protein
MTSDRREVTRSRFFQMSTELFASCRESDSKLPSRPVCSSSRNTKIEILGIVLSQLVTIVGVPSYTSGAQL